MNEIIHCYFLLLKLYYTLLKFSLFRVSQLLIMCISKNQLVCGGDCTSEMVKSLQHSSIQVINQLENSINLRTLVSRVFELIREDYNSFSYYIAVGNEQFLSVLLRLLFFDNYIMLLQTLEFIYTCPTLSYSEFSYDYFTNSWILHSTSFSISVLYFFNARDYFVTATSQTLVALNLFNIKFISKSHFRW